MKFALRALSAAALAAPFILAACGSGGTEPPLFQPKPECEGAPIQVLAGTNAQVISKLEIGTQDDGFDLDGDGKPDNKLAAVGAVAKSSIEDAFKKYDILIPMEFFDVSSLQPDTCVKFAIYLGIDPYRTDGDMDGKEATVPGGDCDDHDPNAAPGKPEIPGNGKDDNCNGIADEDANGNPSTDTTDADGDGVTVAAGDCDDHNKMVHPGMAEICGDGYDNDCDGVADRTEDANGIATACNPLDDTPDPLTLDPRSFDAQGNPLIAFTSGTLTMTPDGLQLDAGPSLFDVNIPVNGDITLELKITGATIKATVVPDGDTFRLINGHLGGVLDARTADTIRGLTVDQIGLTPDESLLDAAFANVLGPLLALPALPPTDPHKGCRTPDIDVDRDGLEAFCDSNPNDDVKTVDLCVDGDGTEVRDEVDGSGNVTKQCTEAVDDKGNPKFVDGISVELNFETEPTTISN